MYYSGLALLLAGFASEAVAQYQTVITPPSGGVPIVSGGYYTSGTVFANGMAYPPGMLVQKAGSIAQAFYYTPQFNGYPSFGSTTDAGVYPRRTYYSSGYSPFGPGYGIGSGGYGYNRGYTAYVFGNYPRYGGYSSFGRGYGGYPGSRGYGGGYVGNRYYGGRRR
jgi:hypothetical protein